jgi:hypothetical protein
VGVIVFPIWYLILFILAWILFENQWIKWIYLASLIPSGLFAHMWFIWLKKLRGMWKYSIMTVSKNIRISGLKSLRTEIITLVDGIMTKWLNC